jgi:hypothetical protein
LWHFHRQRRVYKNVIIQISDDPTFKRGVTTVFNTDSKNVEKFGIGKDNHYIETHYGKIVEVPGTAGRYVRLYSHGNTVNQKNHYIEVEIYGYETQQSASRYVPNRTAKTIENWKSLTIAPASGENLKIVPVPLDIPNLDTAPAPTSIAVPEDAMKNIALNKPVTSGGKVVRGELSLVTDGKKNALKNFCVELESGLQWIQIDLQEKSEIFAIALWHSFSDYRVYRDVIIQVSDDPKFTKNITTVYNNDDTNASGFAWGCDNPYPERAGGRVLQVPGECGRYVRLYSRGNTQDSENQYVEVEVYGRRAITPKAVDLRCESREDALGIDTTTPCLSWRFSTEETGGAQRAYRVRVTSYPSNDSKIFRPGQNKKASVVWDSGEILSSETSVLYAGKPLAPRSLMQWEVSVWDKHGRCSTSQARFSVGLLDTEQWEGAFYETYTYLQKSSSGKMIPVSRVHPVNFRQAGAAYIGFSAGADAPQFPLFRKKFIIYRETFSIGPVFLYVHSFGFHEIYINSRKVKQTAFAPDYSLAEAKERSSVYDVSAYLRKGENEIVLGLAGGGRGPLLLRARLENYYEHDSDGQSAQARDISRAVYYGGRWTSWLTTDWTWQVCDSGNSFINPRWNGDIFNCDGERMNGALSSIPFQEKPLSGGNFFRRREEEKKSATYTLDAVLAGFAWRKVVVVPVAPQKPLGTSIPENFPKMLEAKSISSAGNGVWLVDMGEVVAGCSEVRFPGLLNGEEVTLEYGEKLDTRGELVLSKQVDRYVAVGVSRGGDFFRNKFVWHRFRYVKISGLSAKPEDFVVYPVAKESRPIYPKTGA